MLCGSNSDGGGGDETPTGKSPFFFIEKGKIEVRFRNWQNGGEEKEEKMPIKTLNENATILSVPASWRPAMRFDKIEMDVFCPFIAITLHHPDGLNSLSVLSSARQGAGRLFASHTHIHAAHTRLWRRILSLFTNKNTICDSIYLQFSEFNLI